MSRDLIDRQEIIDALDHVIKNGAKNKYFDGHFITAEAMKEYILAQPSAQPERASCKQVTGKLDLISRQDAIDAIVKCTNCNTPKDLREYVAEHSLWSLWSGGVLEALEAVECLPPTPLYTPDEIQTMQDLEWSQMEKMYELGKEERKKGKWIGKEQFANSPEYYSWQCSLCGCVLEDPTLDKPYPFCPICGSKNAEEEGGEDDTD